MGRLGLYITNPSKDIRYTDDAKNVGEIYKGNDDLDVTVGTGIGSNTIDQSTKTYQQRVFNGGIKYIKMHTLVMPLDGMNKGTGNLFTIRAKKNLNVTSIDIHTALNEKTSVEVWTRLGSYEGHTKAMDGWKNVAQVEVVGRGEGVLTPISQQNFQPVVILSGQSIAFYVTL